jgi:hypothetical protein
VTTTHHEFVTGLRRMADFLDSHPALVNVYSTFSTSVFCDDMDTFSEKCRELGSGEKDGQGGYLNLIRSFGPHDITVCIAKDQSCERVEVGVATRRIQVPADAVPAGVNDDGDAAIYEVVEPVYEWVCPPVWTKAEANA